MKFTQLHHMSQTIHDASRSLVNATFVMGLLCSLSFSAIAIESNIQISEQQMTNLGIQLGKLELANETPLFIAPAKVVIPSKHEFIVSTSQAGLISRLLASVGDRVKKGALVAQINSPDVLALQGRYLKANSELSLAAVMYERDKKLLKEGVIAARREQETRSQYNAKILDVNETEQLLTMAGMSATDIKQLNTRHQLTSVVNVYSPNSGVVIERMATIGTRIDTLAPLYRIADLNELWLEINVPPEHINDIQVGNLVTIENTTITAEIKHVGESVNPDNQTILAKAIIQGPHTEIRPGQRVNINVTQSNNTITFTVPNTAIAQNEGQFFVFVRTKTGFIASAVTVIGKQNEYSVISGHLNGDEDIATKGAVALKANWLGLGREE